MFSRIFRRSFRFRLFGWELDLSLRLHPARVAGGVAKAALAAIPFALLYAGAVITTRPPHDFSASDCFNCHFTVPTDGETRPYRFVSPVNSLCTGCHKKLSPVSHFVNLTAALSYPHGFPVLSSMRLTCATCHDPHMRAVDPADGKKTYMLRAGVAGRAGCLLCHAGDKAPSGLPTRRPVMDKAHGVAEFRVLTSVFMDYSGRALDIRDTLVALDRLSTFCLNCHDAPRNREYTQPGSNVYRHGPDNGLSHPVGIDYNEAAWNNRELRLKDMDPRLPLFDGKIGCCTCHDPYAPGDGQGLVIGQRDGYQDLCFGCHIK